VTEFKLVREDLKASEPPADGERRKWENVGRIFRKEGKSTESNRNRKGWAYEVMGDESDVFKAKGEARDAAIALVTKMLADPAPITEVFEAIGLVEAATGVRPTPIGPALHPPLCPASFTDVVQPNGKKGEWYISEIRRVKGTNTFGLTAYCPETNDTFRGPLGAFSRLCASDEEPDMLDWEPFDT
jgi:hypothetical protein